MTTRRLSPSRRREDVRAWWAEHLAAQGRSGQTQAAYSRARGLDPRYFTLWKGKLQATAGRVYGNVQIGAVGCELPIKVCVR